MPYSYQVELRKVEPEADNGLTFTFESHDDLKVILKRIEENGLFSGDEARAFCLGVKLFSGVLLAHRSEPLFAGLAPEFSKFMRALKETKPAV